MSVTEPTGLDLFPPEASLPPGRQKRAESGTDPRLLFGSESAHGLFVEVEVEADEPAAPPSVHEEAPPAEAIAWHAPDPPEARPRRRLALGLLGAVLALKLAVAFAIRASWIPMPNMFVAAETSAATAPAGAVVPPVTQPPPALESPPATAGAPSAERPAAGAAVSRWWAAKPDVKPAAMTGPRVPPARSPRPAPADVHPSGKTAPKPTAEPLPARLTTSGVAPAEVSAQPGTALVDPPPPPAPVPPAERAPLPLPAPATNVRAAPPAEPAPRADVRENAAVERVLDGYRDAFSQLDVEATQTVWPTVNVKTLERAFGQLQSQQVNFRDCAISVAAAQAFATCEGTAHYVPKVGTRDARAENRTWNFTLSKEGQRWVILAVNSR